MGKELQQSEAECTFIKYSLPLAYAEHIYDGNSRPDKGHIAVHYCMRSKIFIAVGFSQLKRSK